jgi:hypothetical protein
LPLFSQQWIFVHARPVGDFLLGSRFPTGADCPELSSDGKAADLAEVRLVMSIMHPMLRVVSDNETRDDRISELAANFKRLAEAHDKAVRTIENLGPFYPQDIFENLSACLQLVRIEIANIQTGGERTFSMQWNREGEQRVDEFMRAYQQASEAVRQRIATLAMLPQGQT